jgi:hypothetical protein
MAERATSVRVPAAIFPCLSTSSMKIVVRTARSNASPPSTWRFMPAAEP